MLSGEQVRATVAAIAAEQAADGAVPWFRGGRLDPWDTVEAAMALDLGGEHARARAAYRWLSRRQRPDGSWASEYRDGAETSPAAESNHAGYLAVGVWHSWLLTRDESLVATLWPTVRRGLDLVTRMQLPGGAVGWALRPDGTADDTALLTGTASLFQALRCGIALAALRGEAQPDWEVAAADLGTALRTRPDAFADRSRFSMDWYYPVLGGVAGGGVARALLRARWDDFVVEGRGARCVVDKPWVTTGETCELVLALDCAGMRAEAAALFEWVQHLRCDTGDYWTGATWPEDVVWPRETTTWGAGSVLLAADALDGTSATSAFFHPTPVRSSTRSEPVREISANAPESIARR